MVEKEKIDKTDKTDKTEKTEKSEKRRRLLLVEDDQSLGETLSERLRREGLDVVWVQSQAAALEVISSATALCHCDVMLLDVGLPDGSGFEVVRRMSETQRRQTSFLFMTAMNSPEARLEGYELGAEEFVPKPFHLKELLLRLRHVLENHAPSSSAFLSSAALVPLGSTEWELAVEAQALFHRQTGEKILLQTRDCKLLELLVKLEPRVLSRDEILDQIWGEDQFPSPRSVDNAVLRLRQALGPEASSWIRSVRGVGYQWIKPQKNLELDCSN